MPSKVLPNTTLEGEKTDVWKRRKRIKMPKKTYMDMIKNEFPFYLEEKDAEELLAHLPKDHYLRDKLQRFGENRFRW